MPTKAICLALFTVFCLLALAVSYAGQNPNVKVAVHVETHNAKRSCSTPSATIESCDDIITTHPGYSFDAIPVFFDLAGVTACEFALHWPAWTYGDTYNSCSDLIIGGIDWTGAGVTHSWNECQVRGVVIPGWAWIYADGPGAICPVPHPDTGFLGVVDCDSEADTAVSAYCAGVYGAAGDDPCTTVRTEPTTWGSVKTMFR